ncbi:MAG: GPW/gp25 family protein [Gammaproteobacteria bacterium]|nr:GPW/gp25 family protein [Gammaproteobacteria bacterium]
MLVKQYNALQFNHPDFDWDKSNPGFSCSHDGKVALVQGAMAIRQSILLLLSTMPGERIRRPNYGCELYRLTFMPNDATTHGLAIHYVTRALEQWEPRIIITSIDASSNDMDSSKMDINLSYKISSLEIDDELVLTLTLM